MLEFKSVTIKKPEDTNIIIGQAHFIKTVEDIYEMIIQSSDKIKFGLAFCEASGACLIRAQGNDKELIEIAKDNALEVGAGHSFFIVLRQGYPINILNSLKTVPEVCSVYCATANLVEVIVAQTALGRGILGVVDGTSPKGIEGQEDMKWRHDLLRKIGYKL